MKQHIPDIPNKDSIPVIPVATLVAMEKFFSETNVIQRVLEAREKGGEQIGEGKTFEGASRSIRKCY